MDDNGFAHYQALTQVKPYPRNRGLHCIRGRPIHNRQDPYQLREITRLPSGREAVFAAKKILESSMIEYETIKQRAAGLMLKRGWKRLTAKRRGFQQSLFEHTMVELDALISLLPILRKPNHFDLTEEEEKVLIASVIAHDVGKERPEWQEYILGKRESVSDVDPALTGKIIPEISNSLGFVNINEKVMDVRRTCVNRRQREWIRGN